VLQGDWATTDVRRGDIVNLIGNFKISEADKTPTMVLTYSQNILILHPDILIPATAISDASVCVRKPLISSLIRSGNETTPATVWGNMLHEIMQSCLASGEWGHSFLEQRIEHVVRAGLERLVRIDVGIEEARTELRKRAQGLAKFSQKFIRDVPKVHAATDSFASFSLSMN
jgi:DNA replication ATP-dependent helicase Dna2